MAVVHLTPDQMKSFQESESSNPGIAKLYELIKADASKRGGLALEVWRLHMGRIFGDPIIMTPEEVAERLSLPLSTVNQIIEETQNAVRPEWLASPEYKASPFAEM